MLLRRIKQHVQNENWFSVGVDFLIVVIGVFVGLQVQTWNDDRNERKLEESYVARLIEDMERSSEKAEWSNSIMQKQADGATLNPQVLLVGS